MPVAIEQELKSIKAMLRQLLEKQEPEWISEEEAMEMLGRSKSWLKNQRLGVNGLPATLHYGIDWKKVNGRTPFYKRTSIEKRKTLNPQI